jgi:hypothetical protein
MTEESSAVTLGHPPEGLMRALNALLRRLLRTPLAGPLRKHFMVVNVTGKKSGRQYSIPLTAHTIDGALYALTNAAWKHNFRDGADAQVVHNGTTTAMRGELITDPAAVADLSHRCAQSYGTKRAQTLMGFKFRDGTIPTVEEFADAVRREHLAAVKFTPL